MSVKESESKCQKVFASYSKNESLPCFGMRTVTGMPEPLDCRLRDTINGTSQDLPAAQWVENWVWKWRHRLFINLGLHWKGDKEQDRKSRAVLMTFSWPQSEGPYSHWFWYQGNKCMSKNRHTLLFVIIMAIFIKVEVLENIKKNEFMVYIYYDYSYKKIIAYGR